MKHLLSAILTLILCSFGCALDFKSLETVYYPSPAENVHTYFLNGIPFSSLINDSSYVLVFIETGKIASNDYAKLWILYKNLSTTPYLFEPLNHIKLTIETERKTYAGLMPIPPSQIIKSIDNEKNSLMIIQAIGGALKTVAAELTPEATVTTPTGTVYKIDDNRAGDKIIEKTTTEMQGTSYMYEAFKNSVNNGILRRNTIFPQQGVTGNVYFHIGDVDLRRCKTMTLYLTISEGIKVIHFVPMAGE